MVLLVTGGFRTRRIQYNDATAKRWHGVELKERGEVEFEGLQRLPEIVGGMEFGGWDDGSILGYR
jgi:hypothetical protein